MIVWIGLDDEVKLLNLNVINIVIAQVMRIRKSRDVGLQIRNVHGN